MNKKTNKFVFVSNYFNHHQRPFSDAMRRMTDNKYTFIETESMPEERRKLGYKEFEGIDYVDSRYRHGEKQYAECIINSADCIIAGAAPENLLAKRTKEDKLTFRYSERLLKKTQGKIKNLLIALKRILLYRDNAKTYLLCASAYAALDFSKIGKFKNKYYKWGYFPQTKKYGSIDRLIESKNASKILWCGRYIDWKHPDDAVYAAKVLKESGYVFELNMIGTGCMEKTIAEKIEMLGLSDCVHMLGSMPSEKVREYMEKASIYLFTSDQSEGWGAVLNEAMNSGCAVVASHLIGSVPFLVKHKENGLVYHSENINEMCENIKFLLDNPDLAKQIGKKAYETIVNEWNADIAAERIINLAAHIQQGEEYPQLYASGPCSKAEILKENWF